MKICYNDRVQRGFTLVELSVVMVIIGLITAAVLAGKQIIEAAETRSIMAEMRRHMQSFSQFTERYRAYPGDWSNAYNVFKADVDAMVAAGNLYNQNLTPQMFNGNGDGQITFLSGEGTLAWYHMQLAGLTDGGFSGVTTAGGVSTYAVVGSNVPSSKIGSGAFGYYIDYSAAMQNFLALGGQQNAGTNNKSAIYPERAQNIDKKLDDGMPTTGIMQAANGFPAPPQNCISPTGTYNLGSLTGTVVSCVLMLRLN